jgi:coenzyme F420-reducing hydrogenase delta subunit
VGCPAERMAYGGVPQVPHSATSRTQFMGERALRTHVFYCSNHLGADHFSGLGPGEEGEEVRTIGLPCSGKVDVPYLIKAFETGADGVVIVACRKDECRHFEGGPRAHKRAEAVDSLLGEIGAGAGRMTVVECGKDGGGLVLAEIRRFIGKLRNLPRLHGQASVASRQEGAVV